MGTFAFLTAYLIDVVHCDTIVLRFDLERHEFSYGTNLSLRKGQAAMSVREGQLADAFMPSLYMVRTNGMPIMTTLQHWDHGFQSPFKFEIFFVYTTRSMTR